MRKSIFSFRIETELWSAFLWLWRP